jgi:quercetin dioxygenase-like cupin family protein
LSAYEVKRIADFDAIPVSGADVNWRPVRRTLGIRAFGINAYTGDEGKHVVEEHSEGQLRHEEVYVVVAGRARFTLGDDEHEVPTGSLVYVRDPDTNRAAIALEDGTTVLAIGGKPGEAYEPSAWEWWFAAAPYYDNREYERGLEIVREGLREKPGHPVMHYQVACYEALLGNREAALEHLRAAVEGDERALEWARKDDDLVSLRDDPEFLTITGQAHTDGAGA